MKLEISKEQCERLAKLEGDSEIGAGFSTMDQIARDIREGMFPERSIPMILGVGRVADNARAILIGTSVELTDDELSDLHEYLRGWKPAV